MVAIIAKPRTVSQMLPASAIKRVASDTFVFQQDSAPAQRARETIELLERETPDFISSDLWPPTALTSIRLITSSGRSCNSGSIRGRSRMWMHSRSDWLKSGLVWSRTLLTLLSTNGVNCVLVFARTADISNTLL